MEQRGHIKRFLKAIGAEDIKDRTGWVTACCPLAYWRHESGTDGNPSFGIRSDGSVSHCFSCGYNGDPWELLFELKRKGVTGLAEARKALEDLDEALPEIVDEDFEPEDKNELQEFDESWLASFPKAWNFHRGVTYLTQRGVTKEIAEELDLRFDPLKDDRVCFPIRDWDGALRGLHGRTTKHGVEPKYWAYLCQGRYNGVVWLGEEWVDTDRTVVLVESVFDLLAVYPVYRNVMCSLFAGINKRKVQRLSDCMDIVTLYDNDKAGDNARAALDKWLPDSIVRHKYPPKGMDPGEMTRNQIEGALKEWL